MNNNRGISDVITVILIGGSVPLLSIFFHEVLERMDRTRNRRQDPIVFNFLQGEKDAKLLRLSLKAGSDPDIQNEHGQTPLHVITSRKQIPYRTLKILLQFGADPNFPDPGGATPLHLAAQNGDGAVMKALIKSGGDPLIITNHQTETPYALAVRTGNAGTVGAIEQSKKFKKYQRRKKRRGR